MLRRRLAVCALALIVCQNALVFAAPLTSCCPPRAAAVEDAKDCCPAGAHAPGQCPLHGRAKTVKTAPDAPCRMQCDAPHGVQFLLAVAAPLPNPSASLAAPIVSAAPVAAAIDPETRPLVPDLPPPRLR